MWLEIATAGLIARESWRGVSADRAAKLLAISISRCASRHQVDSRLPPAESTSAPRAAFRLQINSGADSMQDLRRLGPHRRGVPPDLLGAMAGHKHLTDGGLARAGGGDGVDASLGLRRQQPGAAVEPADEALGLQRAHGERDGGAARRRELTQKAVRERDREQRSVRRDAPPRSRQVPEDEQQPMLCARQMRDQTLDGEVLTLALEPPMQVAHQA